MFKLALGTKTSTCQLLPNRFSEIQTQRTSRPDRNTNQHSQEFEHIQMNGSSSIRVEDKAVAISSRLFTSVWRHNQQGEGAILELVTHLCDGFRVTSATVIHALADKLDFPHTVRKVQAVRTEVAHFRTSLTKY